MKRLSFILFFLPTTLIAGIVGGLGGGTLSPTPGASSTTIITNNLIPTIGNVSFISNNIPFAAINGDAADSALFNAGISNATIVLGAGIFNKSNMWHNAVVGYGSTATIINDYSQPGGLLAGPAFLCSSLGASNFSGFSWHCMVPAAVATNVSVWAGSDAALTNFIKDVWVSIGDTNEAIDMGYFPNIGCTYTYSCRFHGCWDTWLQQAGRMEAYNTEYVTDGSAPNSGGQANCINDSSLMSSGFFQNCTFTRYGTFATNGYCLSRGTIANQARNLVFDNCWFSNAPAAGTAITNVLWGGVNASLVMQDNYNLALATVNYGTTPLTKIVYTPGQNTNVLSDFTILALNTYFTNTPQSMYLSLGYLITSDATHAGSLGLWMDTNGGISWNIFTTNSDVVALAGGQQKNQQVFVGPGWSYVVTNLDASGITTPSKVVYSQRIYP